MKQPKQQGASVLTILFFVGVFGVVLLLALKVMPVYSEYAEVKQVVSALAEQTSLGEEGIRKAFDDRAAVSDVQAIKGSDLTVVTGEGFVFIRASYQKEIPLIANVGLLFHFDTQAGKPPNS